MSWRERRTDNAGSMWLSLAGRHAHVRVPRFVVAVLRRRGLIDATYIHEHRPDGTVNTTKEES